MKKIDIFILTLIVSVVAFLLFFSRQIFFYHYDPEYYENYYYNSQWNVPQSTRGISDGELYKFVGYRLVQGENPFNINYEVPPFAKYLYGLAEKTIGNPYWVSIGFYFLTGLAIILLSLEIIPGHTAAYLSLLLFVTTPFIATQIEETMLDLPLTCLFAFHALFFTRFFKRSKIMDLFLAGIFLGLATGTKIGVYTPLALLVGMGLCFVSSKKVLNPFIYLVSVFSGYVISFFSYFIRHPNPLPWLRLHEKPLGFYLQTSNSVFDRWAQWRGIFQNTYQGFWVGADRGGLGDWSFVLPLGVILAVVLLIFGLKKKNYSLVYLTAFTFVILIVNTLIPFWPRYLMPIVPLFIIFIVFGFKKFTPMIFLLAVLNFLILFPTLTINNLTGHSEAVARFLNTRAYRELYRSVDSATRQKYPEAKFQAAMENFYTTLRIKGMKVTINNDRLQANYLSDFGSFKNEQTIISVIEHNQWKTVWKWDDLLPGYDPDGHIEISAEKERITPKTTPVVYVIPRLMYDWGKYSAALSALTLEPNSFVDAQVRKTIPDDFPRFVGYLNPGVDPDTIKRNMLPGISIVQEPNIVSGTISFVDSKGNKISLPIKPN